MLDRAAENGPGRPVAVIEWWSRQWWDRASCRGKLGLFYNDDEWAELLACRICSRCEVLDQCREETARLEVGRSPVFGVRAGLRPRDRFRGARRRH